MFNRKNSIRLAASAAALCMIMGAASCGGDTPAPEAETSASETTTTAATTTTKATTTTIKVTTTTTTTPPPLPVMSAYEEYFDTNPDIKGWIRVGGTPIDYPCVQAEDNKYYLTHTFENVEDKNGACFIDYKCKFTTRTRPANTIIYGHNMVTGPSFAKLTTYCPWYYSGATKNTGVMSLDQYKENPTITFDTIWEEGTYKVFAAMYVNTLEKHGDVFKYYKRRDIKSEGQFFDYIGNIMDRSLFYTDVDLQYGDEILTLSTCYYPFGKDVDTRFVLFARRVREGESTDVDVSKAYINPDPLYFKYWYQCYGGSWGGRTWDTTKVKGFDKYYETHEPKDDLIYRVDQ